MKMKNMELIEHINGLTEMIGEGPNLRVRLSHLINRNYGALVEAYRQYEEDLRKIDESDASEDDKNANRMELLSTQIDVPIANISLAEIENEPLNLKQMHILHFMIGDTE